MASLFECRWSGNSPELSGLAAAGASLPNSDWLHSSSSDVNRIEAVDHSQTERRCGYIQGERAREIGYEEVARHIPNKTIGLGERFFRRRALRQSQDGEFEVCVDFSWSKPIPN